MQSFKEILHYIGNFQARLLLTLFYFTLALPFGLVARWGMDPLQLRCSIPVTSAWRERQTYDTDLSAAQRQTWV